MSAELFWSITGISSGRIGNLSRTSRKGEGVGTGGLEGAGMKIFQCKITYAFLKSADKQHKAQTSFVQSTCTLLQFS